MTSTSSQDKTITIDVPEERVPEFYAFYARFLAGAGRGRRRGPGRHGHGPHDHGHHGGCRSRGEQAEAPTQADAPAPADAPTEPSEA